MSESHRRGEGSGTEIGFSGGGGDGRTDGTDG